MGTFHTVVQGDCLSKLAKENGLPSWRRIYDHPKNADFRKKRPDPNLIYPGDKVYIPDREDRRETGSTEQRHRFKLGGEECYLRLWLEDADGKPLEGAGYFLDLGERKLEGEIGADGLLELEIDPADDSGLLVVRPDPDDPGVEVTWQLDLGCLDPVDTISGVQARLNNLGFDCGAVDGVADDWTRAALKRFQEYHGLTVSGEADAPTKAKLESEHRI